MGRRSADLPVARASSIDGEAKVRFVHLDRLIPYARNARTHSPAQVAQIAACIAEFGWTNPVLADAQGIVAGHGRVLAARQLYDAGQDLRLPNGDMIPSGCVPVIDVDGWSDAKRRAYILADNQLATKAGWDMDLLRLEIGELQTADYDISLAGFEDKDLSALFLVREVGETDAYAEWQGMPEYEAQEPCFRKIVMNFDAQEDVDAFAALLQQSIGEKTKSLWFPAKERRDLDALRWRDDAAGDENQTTDAN